jgi:hypothetical protein
VSKRARGPTPPSVPASTNNPIRDRLDSFAEFVANLLDDIYNGNVKFTPIGASVH